MSNGQATPPSGSNGPGLPPGSSPDRATVIVALGETATPPSGNGVVSGTIAARPRRPPTGPSAEATPPAGGRAAAGPPTHAAGPRTRRRRGPILLVGVLIGILATALVAGAALYFGLRRLEPQPVAFKPVAPPVEVERSATTAVSAETVTASISSAAHTPAAADKRGNASTLDRRPASRRLGRQAPTSDRPPAASKRSSPRHRRTTRPARSRRTVRRPAAPPSSRSPKAGAAAASRSPKTGAAAASRADRTVVAPPPPGGAAPAATATHTLAKPAILFVRADPVGSVYLDGRMIGFSPLNGLEIAPGRHLLRIEAKAHKPHQRSVTATPGQRVVVDATLTSLLPPRQEGAAAPAAKPRLRLPARRTAYSTSDARRTLAAVEAEVSRVSGQDVRGVTTRLYLNLKDEALAEGGDATLFPAAYGRLLLEGIQRGQSKAALGSRLLSYQQERDY